MWQMDHPGSDIDLFIAVLAPTNAVLRGEINPDVSWVNYTGAKDQNYHELGRIVQQALKGNWNYLSGVMSPIVLKDWEHLAELRRLTERSKLTRPVVNRFVAGSAESDDSQARLGVFGFYPTLNND